jgi:hypothetical protein
MITMMGDKISRHCRDKTKLNMAATGQSETGIKSGMITGIAAYHLQDSTVKAVTYSNL